MEKFKCKGHEAVEPACKEQQGGQCGALGLCEDVRVTRILIRIKDEVEFFPGLGLSGTLHEWLLSGSSKSTE